MQGTFAVVGHPDDTNTNGAGVLDVTGAAAFSEIDIGGSQHISSPAGNPGEVDVSGNLTVDQIIAGWTSPATLSIDGGSVSLNDELLVGAYFSDGSAALNLTNGAALTLFGTGFYQGLDIGYANATISGGSVINVAGTITLGVGSYDGNDYSYTINISGGSTINAGGDIWFGLGTFEDQSDANSSGSYNIRYDINLQNSTINAPLLECANGSTLNFAGGTYIEADTASVGFDKGITVYNSGALNMLSGINFIVGSVEVYNSSAFNIDQGATVIFSHSSYVGATVFDATAQASSTAPDVVNNGVIEVSSGTLDIAASVSGDGTLTFGADPTLILEGTVAATQNVAFNGGSETLLLGSNADILGRISGFGLGDAIGSQAGSITSFNYDTTTNSLEITDSGGTHYDLKLSGDYNNNQFSINDVGEVVVTCYVRGTYIATLNGECPVESLAIGDMVVTLSGDARPIKWIGRRSYAGWLAAGNPKVMPICFKPGSLADHVPKRALWVSPEHAMYLDDALVPAGLLVNGTSIIKAEALDEIHYFHIELDRHDVIVAEGALSETFVDDDSRGVFHNAPEYYAEHPGYAPQRPAIYCAPRLEEGRELENLRERLAARAARLRADGTAATVDIHGHHDAADRVRIAGWALDRREPWRRVGIVVLCNGAVIARVTADGYRADLEAAGFGDGRHAFELSLGDTLATDLRHEIELRSADDWSLLPGSPRVIEAESGAHSSKEAPIKALGPLRGWLDSAGHMKLSGWAHTTTDPDQPVALIISANDKVLGRVVANRFRSDLQQAGIGQGRHGFEFLIRGGLSRTDAHEIHVRREADGEELPSSPWMLSAGANQDFNLAAVLADIIDKAANAADEDKALALLTQQAETLLRRRAERTSGRAEREALRLFQRRWGRAADETTASGSDTLSLALVIDERAPCANRDAGSVAILSHMRALKALGYAVTFAAFSPTDEETELAQLAKDEGIVTCGKPHYAGIEDVLSRQAGCFDLVYLHRLTMAERYLKLARAHMPKARVIYSVADLHHVRLARQARAEQRPELLAFARTTERSELFAASQADLVVTHSPVEAEILKKHLPPHKVRVVPFAVEARDVLPPFAERQGIAFLGSFDHAPNADAVYWLLQEILPRVWAKAPSLTCKIAGSGWRADRLPGLDPRVEIVGCVPNLDELFATVRLTVAPLRFGAGIKGKVLESFAVGLPCVMSEVAAEGLPLSGNLAEFIGRDVDDLATRILRFHEQDNMSAVCGEQARALVAERFSQTRVTKSLRKALGPLANPSATVHALASQGAA
jgi:glycosyltransferase involved in cell wall biosynthesis